ncbi:MAG: membrane integrity-associated transporter subunit PqiC [Alphaproteobacteria bacterium]|nr:membrane integrity-associated transporter subunit PqiC [Alphaproteobacteria bacterium]MBV9371947.1 membrane integrity-associated transporter subunit PqiC [Alphaproteobacteria bacterium]MBV9900408.1 membrane integrity-associated transporter subunit PqiC [Alphaproteobacteria bacterium]
MTRSFPLLAAALLLPLAGCGFGGKAPAELLTLSAAATRPAAQPRTAGQGNVITVTSPTLPRAISTNRVAVYVGPTSIQYLKEGTWADKPNELFRQLLSETVAARSGWVVVDPSVYTQVQGVVLGGQLLEFGYDPARGDAVVLFEASLARPQQAVTTNRFEARVPVAAADGVSVARALNQASNQVAAQVADWVG